MKKIIILVLLSLSPLILLCSEDEAFQSGQVQAEFALGGAVTSDYSLAYLSGEYGYFFTDKLVAGPGLGIYIPSNNSIVYEPKIWGRYFLSNTKPLLPFAGINMGYIYSPDYTYSTEYSIFCNATVSSSLQKDEVSDTLSILRTTPQAGVYYFLNNNMVLVGYLNYNILHPINDSPAEGYTLEDTRYMSYTVGFCLFF